VPQPSSIRIDHLPSTAAAVQVAAVLTRRGFTPHLFAEGDPRHGGVLTVMVDVYQLIPQRAGGWVIRSHVLPDCIVLPAPCEAPELLAFLDARGVRP